MNFKTLLLIPVIIFVNLNVSKVNASLTDTKSPASDSAKIEEYNLACQTIDALLVKKQFKVGCYSNYQHFGPTSVSQKNPSTIRIAGYNLLHPGTSKALFKDYSLIAKVMNQYDIVSGLEILGTVGHDEVNNKAVISFLQNSPKLVSDLKILISKAADGKKADELNSKLTTLIADTKKAYSLYRGPGYFKILMALKSLDPSWALILSPRGDSALLGSAEEMVGFFYRANNVTPASNPHCSEYKTVEAGIPFACIINLTSKFMGKDYNHDFARRPFMASFKSGGNKFSLVSAHVVYNFSGDEMEAKKLMNDVFGVNQASDIGNGINSSNFARFAEVKTTLNFMSRYIKKYNDERIMFVSDTNLVGNNPYWTEILKNFPGGSLLIEDASTISPPRYLSNGSETSGVASNYDHIVLNKSVFPGCSNGSVYNYYNSDIETTIQKIYKIRSADPVSHNKSFENFDNGGVLVDGDVPSDDKPLPAKLDYQMTSAAAAKMKRLVDAYATELKSMLTVKKNEVVADDFLLQERIDGFKRRVFMNQLTNAFYYRFYQEILSDHFPVSINCKM